MVMYAVGSRYEDAATGGISHFAEHLFFKGTERRPTARHIATEIDGIGAEFNAFTGKEYTGYYVKCAKEHVPIAIDVLGDMLLHSLFDPEEIEREKGVIVEEMNMYIDTPTSYLPSVYDKLCYGDTALGRDIIGTPETVRAATRETFTNHLGRWYVPSRTVIGLGGAVTDEARSALEGLFGSLPAAESPDPEPWTPQPHPRVHIHHKESDSFHIRIGGDGLPLLHPDRYVASVLAAVLGGGMSSRLFTEVRERRGLAYYIGAQHGQYVEAGSLFSQAGVDLKRADEAVTTIVAELRRIATERVPDEELTKARNMLKGRLVLGLEDPRSITSLRAARHDPRGRAARDPRDPGGLRRGHRGRRRTARSDAARTRKAAARGDRPLRGRGALRGPARLNQPRVVNQPPVGHNHLWGQTPPGGA